MFYKLVQSTDFDALEGTVMMTAKEIVAVTSADSKKDAQMIFEFMKRKGLIHFSSGAVKVEEATREEFEHYVINN